MTGDRGGPRSKKAWEPLPYTVSTTPQQLGTDYTGCVTLLVMIGKSVCPSCQKPHERLEYYCTSEIYGGITLLSASTVYIMGYILCFVESDLTTRVRGIAVCRCTLRENKTSKQGKHICTFVCVFVSRFLQTSLTSVTYTRQHSSNKLYYGKLRCLFK